MGAIVLPRTDMILDPLGATAAQWASKWFGGPTSLVISRPSMGVAVSRVLIQNPRRLFWQIFNLSVNSVSIGFDNALTLTNGVPLAPSAGWVSMAVQEDGEAVAYEVIGIASVAASSLYCVEVIRT